MFLKHSLAWYSDALGGTFHRLPCNHQYHRTATPPPLMSPSSCTTTTNITVSHTTTTNVTVSHTTTTNVTVSHTTTTNVTVSHTTTTNVTVIPSPITTNVTIIPSRTIMLLLILVDDILSWSSLLNTLHIFWLFLFVRQILLNSKLVHTIDGMNNAKGYIDGDALEKITVKMVYRPVGSLFLWQSWCFMYPQAILMCTAGPSLCVKCERTLFKSCRVSPMRLF